LLVIELADIASAVMNEARTDMPAECRRLTRVCPPRQLPRRGCKPCRLVITSFFSIGCAVDANLRYDRRASPMFLPASAYRRTFALPLRAIEINAIETRAASYRQRVCEMSSCLLIAQVEVSRQDEWQGLLCNPPTARID